MAQEQVKPSVPFEGADSNIFFVVARCGRALKRAGLAKEAAALYARIPQTESYDEAIAVCLEYVELE